MRSHSPLSNKLFNRRDSKSFYATLLLSFLVTSITSSLLLTGFLTANYLTSMTTATKYYNEQLLSQTNYAINQTNKNVENVYFSLMSNNHITAFFSLSDAENTTPVLAGRELDKQLMVLSYVESIYLYNAPLNLLYSSDTGYQEPLSECGSEELTARLQDTEFLLANSGKPIATSFDQKGGSAEIFSYYFPDAYTAHDGHVSTVIINTYASTLTDSIAAMKDLTGGGESSFILLDSDNSYLTGVLSAEAEGHDNWVNSALRAIFSNTSAAPSFIVIDGIRYFQILTDANIYGWQLLNFIPAKIIFEDIIFRTLVSSLILIGVFLFSFFICMHFAHQLNKPVETLTSILRGKPLTSKLTSSSDPREFQMISEAVSSLQDKNRKLRSLQQKSRYSLTQSCLNDLVTNRNQDSPALLRSRLNDLNLTYLMQDKLCMVVIKVDNYSRFLTSHNSEELWVLRFSVVNIIEELVSASFTCNAFSRDDDTFVLLLSPALENGASDLEPQMIELFHLIQENISSYLNFTVTIAYSTVFQGLDKLPAVYKNMKNALLLKMRYGHESIIAPYQTDDVPDEPFQPSYRLTSQLIDRLSSGQYESAWAAYESLTANLFYCDYSEIMSTIIHLAYSIYERLTEKYPMIKDDMTKELRFFLATLQTAEVSSDIQDLTKNLLEHICSCIQKMKENPANENFAVVAEKVTSIIQQTYPDPSLCLCSIAEEIGLSTNYAGHIFRQQTQKSVSQYILEVRMDKLAHYLQTTALPLNSILEKVGLEKNNYFYTRFKNYFGMPLNEYRLQFQISATSEE